MRAAEAPVGPARPPLAEAAPAKLNLTLHVAGRRADGYHELESLVAFAALGDRLTATPAPAFSLAVRGPFGPGLPAGSDNLVLRAAEALARARHRVPEHLRPSSPPPPLPPGEGGAGGTAGPSPLRAGGGVGGRHLPHQGRDASVSRASPAALALRLEKRLPVAAGLGGGSADAAAALRLLSRLWQVPVPPALAAALGADVPACLAAPGPQVMRGTGERLAAAPPLPAAWAVLVNPRIALPTGPVFAALGRTGPPGPALPPRWPDFAALREWLAAGRNDLEIPARTLCPAVGAVLEALAAAPVARMSGSGATCFALHPAPAEAEAQAAALRRARPDWWIAVTPLAG